MACKKNTIKVIKYGAATLPEVVSYSECLTDGTIVKLDPATVTTCPESEIKFVPNQCVNTGVEGQECVEGATVTYNIVYDCTTDTTTTEVISITLPDLTVAPEGTVVVPCPEYTVITAQECVVGKTEEGEGAVEEIPVEAPVEGRLFN